jgi:alpha-D-ribose 1-methylphosphonate 5-triphosphate synthase subunit PhnG
MVKMRETAKNSLFYIGELLVTEAKVQIQGRMGIGIIAGDAPEAARELAIVDAAYNARLDETEGWEKLLVEEELRISRWKAEEAARIARTKVDFESMDRV